MTLNMYGTRRFVALEGMAKACSYPSRGIAAGCGFATFRVQVLALPSLRGLRARRPEVGITMFIDDLVGQTRHRSKPQIVNRLVEAAADLHNIIEEEWECKLAEHKSAIVASTDGLCKDLQRAFKRHSGSVGESAVNLGVDFSGA